MFVIRRKSDGKFYKLISYTNKESNWVEDLSKANVYTMKRSPKQHLITFAQPPEHLRNIYQAYPEAVTRARALKLLTEWRKDEALKTASQDYEILKVNLVLGDSVEF